MKLIIMAAALTLGGTAAAQTTDTPTGVMDAVARDLVCAGIKTVKADNSNPERDARGYEVQSSDAMAPDCYNEPPKQVPGTGPLPTVPRPIVTKSEPLEACTATRTDRCTQTYEKGRRR